MLLVLPSLVPSQMAHWRSAQNLGVDLFVAGTLVQPPSGWWETRPPTGLETFVFKPKGWVRRGQLWWFYPGLRRLIETLRPDVIQVENEPWALFYSQTLGSGSCVVGHGADNIWLHGSKPEQWIRIARSRRNLRRMCGLAGWNSAAIALARRHGLPVSAPTLIAPSRLPDPVPFSTAARDPQRHRAEFGIGEEVAVGFVGRLDKQKGVDWLLKSYAQVQSAASRLYIFGSGPAERTLRRMAEDLAPSVEFVGDVPYKSMPRLMAALDILVVPSRTTQHLMEQFGRVVVEAMYASTAVISSDSGALPEVVGEGGITVPEDNQNELADAISALVSDVELREMWGDRGQSWALERWSPRALAAGYVDLWKGAMAFAASTD